MSKYTVTYFSPEQKKELSFDNFADISEAVSFWTAITRCGLHPEIEGASDCTLLSWDENGPVIQVSNTDTTELEAITPAVLELTRNIAS